MKSKRKKKNVDKRKINISKKILKLRKYAAQRSAKESKGEH